MTLEVLTLGCKLNFAESSAILRNMLEHGFTKSQNGIADMYIINTCAVTATAESKCRHMIQTVKHRNPQAIIAVTGCYAQLRPEEIASIPGIDLVLGAEEKLNFERYLQTKQKRKKALIFHCPSDKIEQCQIACSSNDRTRHFLKVQDGCDYFCSYCTIPFARGKSRSCSIDEVIKLAQKAIEDEAKEIVLTGVNTGDFGRKNGETFFDLVKRLDNLNGIERFRISSIEPNLLTDEMIAFISTSKRFAPHFHIPLQSGSDAVLKLMGRRYNTEFFQNKINTIKKHIPNAFIGIDVIVGTNGETPELFDETYQFLQRLDFSQLHVFSYSRRAGTRALYIKPSVRDQEKKRRSLLLHQLSDEKLKTFYSQNIGKKGIVLWEESAHKKNTMYGFTENYIRIAAPKNIALANTTETVILGDFTTESQLSLQAIR